MQARARDAESSGAAGSGVTTDNDPIAQVPSAAASTRHIWRLSRDALVEAPSDLRLKAKRGDPDVHVYG